MKTIRIADSFIRIGDTIEAVDVMGATVIGTVVNMTLHTSIDTGDTYTILFLDRVDADPIAVFTNQKQIFKVKMVGVAR